MKNNNDIFLYKLGLILLAVLILFFILFSNFQIIYKPFLFPCLLHRLTGLYCPGCGGTRAVMYLINGEILSSIKYNPIVAYGAFLYVWFMLSNTVQLISNNRIKVGMSYSDKYLWFGLILMLLNCLIKNFILIVFKIPLI